MSKVESGAPGVRRMGKISTAKKKNRVASGCKPSFYSVYDAADKNETKKIPSMSPCLLVRSTASHFYQEERVNGNRSY